MSSVRLCSSCGQLNPSAGGDCPFCGMPPTERKVALAPAPNRIDRSGSDAEEDTVPAVHVDAPELNRWTDSRTGGIVSDAAPLDLTFRSLDDFPVLNDIAPLADLLPPGVVTRSEPVASRSSIPPVTKAARRADVRRRRLSGDTAPLGKLPVPTEVLVLEPGEPGLELLCGLLEGFGFRVDRVHDRAQAERLLDAQDYAAVFLDILFDGPDLNASVDLCRRVKVPLRRTADRVPVLVIVSGSTRPTERVRATLAGGDAYLPKPATRGAVAQALEACGVALPADSRRG